MHGIAPGLDLDAKFLWGSIRWNMVSGASGACRFASGGGGGAPYASRATGTLFFGWEWLAPPSICLGSPKGEEVIWFYVS